MNKKGLKGPSGQVRIAWNFLSPSILGESLLSKSHQKYQKQNQKSEQEASLHPEFLVKFTELFLLLCLTLDSGDFLFFLYAFCTEAWRRSAVAHAAQFCRVGTLGLTNVVFTPVAHFSRFKQRTVQTATEFSLRITGGLQRNVVYLGWPIAPSYMSLDAEGGEELRGLS